MRKLTLGLLAAMPALVTGAQTIPSGTTVSVRLGQTISSDKARPGDSWAGTLSNDVVVDGRVVARRGDPVQGRVVDAKASGRLSGTALVALQSQSNHNQAVEDLFWALFNKVDFVFNY